MDLFTMFYNIEKRGYVMELQEDSLWAHKGGGHMKLIGKLTELGIQEIKLEDKQPTVTEH